MVLGYNYVFVSQVRLMLIPIEIQIKRCPTSKNVVRFWNFSLCTGQNIVLHILQDRGKTNCRSISYCVTCLRIFFRSTILRKTGNIENCWMFKHTRCPWDFFPFFSWLMFSKRWENEKVRSAVLYALLRELCSTGQTGELLFSNVPKYYAKTSSKKLSMYCILQHISVSTVFLELKGAAVSQISRNNFRVDTIAQK